MEPYGTYKSPIWKGKWSEPNLHEDMEPMLILRGCTLPKNQPWVPHKEVGALVPDGFSPFQAGRLPPLAGDRSFGQWLEGGWNATNLVFFASFWWWWQPFLVVFCKSWIIAIRNGVAQMKQGQTLFLRFGCENPSVVCVPFGLCISQEKLAYLNMSTFLNFFFLKVTNICQTAKINVVRKPFLNSSILLGPIWTLKDLTISFRIHVRHLLTYIWPWFIYMYKPSKIQPFIVVR